MTWLENLPIHEDDKHPPFLKGRKVIGEIIPKDGQLQYFLPGFGVREVVTKHSCAKAFIFPRLSCYCRPISSLPREALAK